MSKRSQGTGSVTQLVNGRFWVRVTIDGKRRPLGTYDTEDEAREVLEAALHKLATAHHTPIDGLTLRGFGRAEMARRELSGLRIKREKTEYARFVERAPFADWHLAKIRRADVRAWVLQLLRTKKSRDPKKTLHRNTVIKCLSLLRVILQAAVEADLIDENPAYGVRVHDTGDTRDVSTHLTFEEQRRLLECPKIPLHDRLIIAIAIATGCRLGELRSQKLEDVHINCASPHMIVRYSAPGVPRKNGKIVRVNLFGFGLDAVRTWLQLLPSYCPRNPHGLLLPTRRGDYRRKDALLGKSETGNVWHEYCELVGIRRNVRWHDLRHTCGVSLLAGWFGTKWQPHEVQKHLGHDTPEMTLHYAKVVDDTLSNLATKTSVTVRFGL